MFGMLGWKTSNDAFSGFDAGLKYDGMTDRQTDTDRTAVAYT